MDENTGLIRFGAADRARVAAARRRSDSRHAATLDWARTSGAAIVGSAVEAEA